MNVRTKTLQITRTAAFIALLVVIQAVTASLGNTIVTGTLVNAILIIAVMTGGLWPGMTAALVSPVLAKLIGIGPLWGLIPFIAAGNIIFVTVWHFLGDRKGMSGDTGCAGPAKKQKHGGKGTPGFGVCDGQDVSCDNKTQEAEQKHGGKGIPGYAAWAAALIAAAAAKFLALYLGIVKAAVPLLLKVPEPQAGVVSGMFSLPQLVTALLGGIVALPVLAALKKADLGRAI